MHRPKACSCRWAARSRDARSRGCGIAPTLGAAEMVAAVPASRTWPTSLRTRRCASRRVARLRRPDPARGVARCALRRGRRRRGRHPGHRYDRGDRVVPRPLVASDAPVVVTGLCVVRRCRAPMGGEPAGRHDRRRERARARPGHAGRAERRGCTPRASCRRCTPRCRRHSRRLRRADRSRRRGPRHLHSRFERMPHVALPPSTTEAPVALVRMALGDDGRMLAALPGLGYRGAVIEAMGAGHVAASVAPRVGDLVGQMPVVLSVRVPAGPVFTKTYGFDGWRSICSGAAQCPPVGSAGCARASCCRCCCAAACRQRRCARASGAMRAAERA